MRQYFDNWAALVEAAPEKFKGINLRAWFNPGSETWIFDSTEGPKLSRKNKLPERVGDDEVILSGPSSAFEKVAKRTIVPAEALLNGELVIKGNPRAQLELHKFFEVLLED